MIFYSDLRFCFLIILVISAAFNEGLSQERKSRRALAEDYYERLEFANAALAFERLVDVNKPNLMYMEHLANSYFCIKEYNLAENWYARVVSDPKSSKEAFLNYAKVLKELGKYPEAKLQYQGYLSKYGEDVSVQLELKGIDSAIVWMEHPTVHKLRNEKNINTSLSEFGLVPTSGGAIYAGEPDGFLAAQSGMTGNSYLRVYSAERDEENSLKTSSIMAESFNHSLYHVGPLTTNAEENVLYVTRTYPGDKSEKLKLDGSRWLKQNLELKIYTKEGSGWKESDFPYNNVKEYSTGHATLSSDQKILYFASNRPGGLGGVDIWYCSLQEDGSWSVPQNAGSAINTAGDEMFPTIYGDVLYFSSTGHVGMGGLDIFESIGSGNKFSTPRNMGFPINSAADDFSFVVEGDSKHESYGYLSSNRVGGVGADDIYSFDFQKPRIRLVLEGVVKDKVSMQTLEGAKATLYASQRTIQARGTTNKDGLIQFDLEEGVNYKLLGEFPGYHSDTVSVANVVSDRDTVIKVVVALQPIYKKGDRFVLEDIYYDFDKHNIRSDATLVLDQLVSTLRDNPTLCIELSSHTDSRGSDSYNEKLSQRRASAAVEYIISRGIARERLVAKGYGEKRLRNACSNGVSCSEEDHQWNRRTEVEVLNY